MYELTSTVLQLPSMVGCQDFPNTPQGMKLVKLIQDFINEEYNYSGEVVKKAFMMAAKQELYLDNKRVDASTFGQHLSVQVVGKVLTAYKETLRQSNARPQGYSYKQLPEAPKKLITNKESWELILQLTKDEGQPPMFAPYRGAYNYLLEQKRVQNVGKPSNRFEKNIESAERQAVESYLKKHFVK